MFNFLSDTSDGTSMVHLGGSQMAAKKIPKEEIDRVKFMENIRNQINLMSKAIKDVEKQILTFQDLYLRVINEEIDYNLKFYIVGDGLQYERKGRKKIGF